MSEEIFSKQQEDEVIEVIGMLKHMSYANSKRKGFWEDEEAVIDSLEKNSPEFVKTAEQAFLALKLDLIHSEVSEALEAVRAGRPYSAKIPGYENLTEELADTCVRIFDLCGKLELELGGAIVAKMKYNATRPYKHGKKF